MIRPDRTATIQIRRRREEAQTRPLTRRRSRGRHGGGTDQRYETLLQTQLNSRQPERRQRRDQHHEEEQQLGLCVKGQGAERRGRGLRSGWTRLSTFYNFLALGVVLAAYTGSSLSPFRFAFEMKSHNTTTDRCFELSYRLRKLN